MSSPGTADLVVALIKQCGFAVGFCVGLFAFGFIF